MKGLLELEGVSVGYTANNLALCNINLTVKEGELFVLAGPNGSGKTTLLKTAGGLLKAARGQVRINGKEISRLKPRQRASLTAFLFQLRDNPWSFTVRETVTQGCFARRGWFGTETRADREAVNSALEKAELRFLADRRINELSGGELQRVYIARCITQGAAFLLLDEPDNNLDPKYAYLILTLLSELVQEGRGVIVSLHDLRLASRFAHRIALLSQTGSISAIGTAIEVLTEENLGRVYDLNPELVRDLIL